MPQPDVPQQILEVATRLMAERGYDGTSLSAIADEVGVRKASLLYHFPSKDNLRLAVLDRLLSHWNEALPRLLLAAAGAGETRFGALLTELLEFFSTDRDRARLLLREMLDRPDAMREYLQRAVRPWIALIGQHIRSGQRDGGIRDDVDPEAYVLNIVGLALVNVSAAEVLGGLMTDDSQATDRYARELMRLARVSFFDKKRLTSARKTRAPSDPPITQPLPTGPLEAPRSDTQTTVTQPTDTQLPDTQAVDTQPIDTHKLRAPSLDPEALDEVI